MKSDGRNRKDGSDGKPASHSSHKSHSSQQESRVLPPRGDYRTLLSFHKAELVYDLTFRSAPIGLTNVARASLEELLDDYVDYLRARDHPIWEKDSQEARYVRRLGRKTPASYEDYRDFMETRPPAVMANIAICLIHQANYLIDKQLLRLERDFVEQGGLRERMTRARLKYRDRHRKS